MTKPSHVSWQWLSTTVSHSYSLPHGDQIGGGSYLTISQNNHSCVSKWMLMQVAWSNPEDLHGMPVWETPTSPITGPAYIICGAQLYPVLTITTTAELSQWVMTWERCHTLPQIVQAKIIISFNVILDSLNLDHLSMQCLDHRSWTHFW